MRVGVKWEKKKKKNNWKKLDTTTLYISYKLNYYKYAYYTFKKLNIKLKYYSSLKVIILFVLISFGVYCRFRGYWKRKKLKLNNMF